jgi:hypothetical protein
MLLAWRRVGPTIPNRVLNRKGRGLPVVGRGIVCPETL